MMQPQIIDEDHSSGVVVDRIRSALRREVVNILDQELSTLDEMNQLWSRISVDADRNLTALTDLIGIPIEPSTVGSRSKKSPLLFLVDIGLSAPNLLEIGLAGRVLAGSADGRPLRTIITGQMTPDGIDICTVTNAIFWTSMGSLNKNDGSVLRSNLDGTNITTIVPKGSVHTPKQLCIDHQNSLIYFCDREGLRVMRCAFDGSQLETILQTGDWQDEAHIADKTNWCVGVVVSASTGKFYWTQKGPSKGNKGRIFCANITFLPGENAKNRSDVVVLFQNLPEPVDLDLDEEKQTLYWTDRGELPTGNSVNRAMLLAPPPSITKDNTNFTSCPGRDYEIISRNLHEAVGIKLDLKNRHVYVTDMGGSVYQMNMDGSDRKQLYDGINVYTGITIKHL